MPKNKSTEDFSNSGILDMLTGVDEDLSSAKIEAAIDKLRKAKMPPDFSVVLLKDYMYIDENYKEKLMTIPEFTRWLQTKGRLMNGSV